MSEHKLQGTVLMVKEERLLVLAENKYYIVKGEANNGDLIDFDPALSLPMPSYLFAIAAMEEENLGDTLDFIQSRWFTSKK